MAEITADPEKGTLASIDPLKNETKQRSLWGDAWRTFRKHKPAIAGMVLLVVFFLFCFVGIVFWDLPHNSPYVYETNVRIGGSSEVLNFNTGETDTQFHPFGTDEMGQDMLARIMFGGRISLAVGLMACYVLLFAQMNNIQVFGAEQGEIQSSLMGGESGEGDGLPNVMIYEAAASPRLASIIRSLEDAAVMYIGAALETNPGLRDAAVHDHGEILEAVERRDVEAAIEAIKRHLELPLKALRHLGR